jgi:hypothetical protein
VRNLAQIHHGDYVLVTVCIDPSHSR